MVRAFLIGAGATRAAYPKSPLCNDFFYRLNRDFPNIFNPLESTLRPHLQGQSLLHLNVEDVMKIFRDFPSSIKTVYNQTLYTAIYKLIAEPTDSTEGYLDLFLKGEILEHPKLFNTLLRTGNLNVNDFFMTLNYDFYLDREILLYHGSIDYGIPKPNIIDSSLELNFKSELSIYHLHGSLNWEWHSKEKVRIRKGAISPRHTKIGSNIYLVPPGKKDFYPVLELIWETAEERLIDADELIIIGCSLNRDDNKLMSLIKNFVSKKGGECVKIIYLGDNNVLSNNHVEQLGNGYQAYSNGFVINGPQGFKGAIEFIND